MDVNAKEMFKKICGLSETMAQMADLHEKMDLDEDFEVSSLLKIDIFCFLAYLAASDNIISWNETRYISELLDLNLTPNKLNELIIEKNIYSTEFEAKPPMMLQLFVALDNAIYESGAAIDEELGSVLMKFYMVAGIGLVESNGESIEEEFTVKQDFEIYINMMRSYLEENTLRHHTDIIFNYSKNGYSKENSVTKNSSGAVKAPKKKM